MLTVVKKISIKSSSSLQDTLASLVDVNLRPQPLSSLEKAGIPEKALVLCSGSIVSVGCVSMETFAFDLVRHV